MNKDSKEHMLKSLRENLRFDGRRLSDFREISLELGVSDSAEGSARVRIGDTEVIAGVKLGVESPYPDTPDQGNLIVGTELLPIANPAFEPGPPGTESIEISRVVDRGIRESKVIDIKALCITPGEKVWAVNIDICSINDSGNLIDCAALATVAAIKDTVFPEFDGESVDYKKKSSKRLPLAKSRMPVTVTVVKIGEHLIVDPGFEEEAAIDARLTVASTAEGVICSMQKGGDKAISTEDVSSMIDLALLKAREISKVVERA
ncbi:RNA-binding protein [Candidatus Woesearchaeota archaeon CG08_land_8_20_14_0_20_47_9]|nr:MAG: RNA-binding protein [Candidatus Woesearchaeota archaeon CG10_big_fil_rev_8_21_14_0_10_47_5]PIO03689.1 MAG: RNA-binding protein [Candidatus Woesearchaeota archaeon CG08_land_8_20_14_0_20_47_9]HII30103.1 exosome complex protein Rrp42 [Candidatus Woesearchaeota archaeon]